MGGGLKITEFEGMRFMMYYGDHLPMHITVISSDDTCTIGIKDVILIDGCIPSNKLARAMEWTKKYRNKLWKMWETQKFKKLPSLESKKGAK